jgi:hypothetical protein
MSENLDVLRSIDDEPIKLEPYDLTWPSRFETEREVLQLALAAATRATPLGQPLSHRPENAIRPGFPGRIEYRYRDSNPGFRHERAAS